MKRRTNAELEQENHWLREALSDVSMANTRACALIGAQANESDKINNELLSIIAAIISGDKAAEMRARHLLAKTKQFNSRGWSKLAKRAIRR